MAIASPIRISGTVYDRADNPLSGVELSLSQAHIADTSKTPGTWSLVGEGTPVGPRANFATLAHWTGRSVLLDLSTASTVSVDAYDLRGSRRANLSNLTLSVGKHELPLDLGLRSMGMVWLRLSINGHQQTLLANPGITGAVNVASSSSEGAVARTAAADGDTLRVTWKGRLTAAIPVKNLDTTGFVIKLDTGTSIPWNESVTYGSLYDSRDGQVYRTINANGRVWMAENLNHAADRSTWTSVAGNEKGAIFGRLYSWQVALKVPDTCYSLSCANMTLPAQGLCPVGWHIPAVTELNTLATYAGTGKDLASRSGWGNWLASPPYSMNGTDRIGFRGLPAGTSSSSGGITDVGVSGWWLIANPDNVGTYGCGRSYNGQYDLSCHIGSVGMSLRCMQDRPEIGISLISDTTITVSDVAKFAVHITAASGVAKVVWNYADGSSDTTFTGSDHQVIHKYPGSDIVSPGQKRNFLLSVVAFDSLGNAAQQSATVTVVNDIPVVAVPKMFGVLDSLIPLHAIITERGTITKLEWSIDGIHFTLGKQDTALRLPNQVTLDYPVYVRVTDEDGNVSLVDTIHINVREEFIDSRDGQHYAKVQIGNQVWMGRDLTFDTAASVSGEYADGGTWRQYTWATAMKLPSVCDSSACTSQILPKHQGLCPAGWHVPSDSEWTVLVDAVGGSAAAGTKLKLISGWRTNDGTDDFGFGARPNQGESGAWWWTPTEVSKSEARNKMLWCDGNPEFYGGVFSKIPEQGLRCLQN